MDEIIQPTVVLLILSLITEKIANFIKLQNDTMAHRTNISEDEKVREKKIQQLSIIVGVVVALAAKANLFDFFSKDFKLYWHKGDFEFFKLVSNIIGCIISGLFLSLGSKFFHDLLDILLQIKNLKRKLNDKEDWNFSSSEEITQYFNENETKRVESALQVFIDKYMKIENVTTVFTVFENEEPVIKVGVNNHFDSDNLIPKKVYYPGYKNIPKEARVEIIQGFQPITHAKIYPSDKISNLANLSEIGAMGGKVYDLDTEEEYFISCFHVVKTSKHKWENTKQKENKSVVDKTLNSSNCGLIVKTLRDDEVDVAVMRAVNDIEISPAISGIGTPFYSRTITPNDKAKKLKVVMKGSVSGYREGIIIDDSSKVKISYTDGSVNEFRKLIKVSGTSHSTFSQPGDSGSFVLDTNNYLIGMVVGGYENTSYLIPIETILKKTKTKLIKTKS
jgi:hypothetical protein